MVRQDVSARRSRAYTRHDGAARLYTTAHRIADNGRGADAEISAEQRQLNELYDAFTTKTRPHFLAPRTSARLDADSSYYLLCSLEILDEDGKLERKSDMFTKRTIQPHRPVEHTETEVESLGGFHE